MDAEDMLRDLGCRSVIAAATVVQALQFIETIAFDAALVDLNLNGQRSYVVADALAVRAVPFAFATGYGASGLREVDLIRPILMKPYREDELARTMACLLGG
ncbi:MAG: response regulator, partial [Caulobacteraceae bacterium]